MFSWIYLFVVICLANSVQIVTGFGSTVLTVALASYFFSLRELIPILVVFSLLLSSYTVARNRSFVNHSIFWKRMVPWTLVGLVGGMVLFNILHENSLRRIFGLFITTLAIYELHRLFSNPEAEPFQATAPHKGQIWLLGGGIIQGLYASGGPLIVYYATRAFSSKGEFRTTLSMLWLVLNSILLLQFIFQGKMNLETCQSTGMLFPAVLVGIFLGEFFYKKVSPVLFKKAVFCLLLIGGVFMMVKA